MSTMSLPLAFPSACLLVSNMHCPSCVETITRLLSPLACIRNLQVSLLLRTLTFAIDTDDTPPGKIVDEVVTVLTSEGGFEVEIGAQEQAIYPPGSIGHGKRNQEEGWRIKLFMRGDERRRRKQQTARRQRHLEHCVACQAGEDEGVMASGSNVFPDETTAVGTASPAFSVSGSDPEKAVRTILSIGDMTCAACASAITTALESHPSVLAAQINLLSSSGTVRHHPSLAASEVANLVEEVGFGAEVVRSETEAGNTNILRPGLRKTTIMVEGMTCASCSTSIKTALRDHSGIQEISVDVLGNKAVVVHTSEICAEDIKSLIEETGFGAEITSTVPLHVGFNSTQRSEDRATGRAVTIRINGIFCQSCIDSLNDKLASLPLISFSPLALENHTTTVSYVPHQPLTIRTILEALSGVAEEFETEVVRPRTLAERSQGIQRREVRTLALHLGAAVIIAIPTFIIAIVGMVLLPSSDSFRMKWMAPTWGAANLGTIVLWPMSTVVQFGIGRLFYRRAFASVIPRLMSFFSPSRHRSRQSLTRRLSWRAFLEFGSMDLLVVLSTSVSYFASIAMLGLDIRASPGSPTVGTYFDSCVFLIMFILVGRTLEAYAKSRTTDAVSMLGEMRPDTALLVETSGSREEDLAHPTRESFEDEVNEKSVHDAPATGPTSTRSVPVSHLEIGDLVMVQPGALPPADGVIVSGSTTFDESSLTGESRPIPKTVNDEIYSGTTNKSGAITIQVTKLSQDTMLEKIIAAVSEATGRKAPIEKLAERLTGVFVPIIVYLSLVVLAIWLGIALSGRLDVTASATGGRAFFAIEFAIATLVVACPCGIGLAVPCANAVGNGIAARSGILASGGGEAFLAATKVTTIAFDKTGTLTEGKLKVTDEFYKESLSGHDGLVLQPTLLAAVRALEGQSTHPLAQGVIEHLEKDEKATDVQVEVEDSVELPGRGLKASIKAGLDTFDLLVGNEALMTDEGVDLTIDQRDMVNKWSDQAKSLVLVATRAHTGACYRIQAMFALSDPPRETSSLVMAQLKARGIRVLMLSGDNDKTARAMAKVVGINEGDVIAGMTPQGKADVIARLQEEPLVPVPVQPKSRWINFPRRRMTEKVPKQVVMFVGDGINDSIALSSASVSVAMGHSSQSLLASSDFVLLSSDLSSLLLLLSLSAKVYRRQKLNLVWACVFNIVCLPFAAGVFYAAGGVRLTPVWSAVLMAGSSVSVVGSSLAMRWGF